LKINCNKQCWINYILLLFLSYSYSWIHTYYKRINVSPLSYFPYIFSGIQKSLTRLTQPFTHFYVVFLYYWTYSRPEYSWNTARWTLINNQSTNLPPDITCTLALVKDVMTMVSFYRFSPKLYWQLLYDFTELLLKRTLIHMILIYPLRNDLSVCLVTVSLSHYNISRKGPRISEWHINCIPYDTPSLYWKWQRSNERNRETYQEFAVPTSCSQTKRNKGSITRLIYGQNQLERVDAISNLQNGVWMYIVKQMN
jgi:hypothetical protein